MSKYQVVRYKSGKHTFEVMTKPGSVSKYRLGQLDISNVLEADIVFKDINKGDKAASADLVEVFKTDNPAECCRKIVDDGHLQLTDAERKEILEKKRREIVNYLHKYFVDPKTKAPHPVIRIENALVDLKYRVDPDIAVEKQVQEIMKNMPGVLAMRKMDMTGWITIPHAHLGVAQGQLKKFVNVKHERYDDNGCEFEVTLVPGDYDALMSMLNNTCKGEYDIKIEGASDLSTSSNADSDEKGGKGKARGGGKQQGGGSGRGGKKQ
jgi:ribosome maturation protein SDO1